MTKAEIITHGQALSVRIDLHVHTSFGSACAELHNPDTLPEAMEKQNLNGVVITEHNTLWPRDMIRKLNRRLPPNRRIYSGVEVSTSRCHVVVIGLDQPVEIFSGMTPELLCSIATHNLAVAILVHPYLTSNGFDPDKERLPGFHGMEVASTMTRGDFRIKTLILCKKSNIFPVAGSDAHCSENLGKAFTCFPHLPADEKELAFMIKQGIGVPMALEDNGKISEKISEKIKGEALIVC